MYSYSTLTIVQGLYIALGYDYK